MANFNWSPGMGDPTIGGWITVILYLLAAISCWKTAFELATVNTGVSQERRAWRAISALFLALGINKQLDLQTALTEAGRMLAHSEGGTINVMSCSLPLSFSSRLSVLLLHSYC